MVIKAEFIGCWFWQGGVSFSLLEWSFPALRYLKLLLCLWVASFSVVHLSVCCCVLGCILVCWPSIECCSSFLVMVIKVCGCVFFCLIAGPALLYSCKITILNTLVLQIYMLVVWQRSPLSETSERQPRHILWIVNLPSLYLYTSFYRVMGTTSPFVS